MARRRPATPRASGAHLDHAIASEHIPYTAQGLADAMQVVESYTGDDAAERARLEMARDPIVWWSLAAAFVFMFTLVLAANLFADVVRDAFDPRLRQR